MARSSGAAILEPMHSRKGAPLRGAIVNPTPLARRSSRAAAAGALLLCGLLAACAVPVERTTRVYEAPGYRHAYVQPVYARYGTVQRVEVVDTRAGETGGGTALGAVIGGVLGNQFGHGAGRAATTALGVFGGAVAGNQIERNQAAAASGRVVHVHVQFDDGGRQVFDYADVNGLQAGERVKFENGSLQHG
jgi:outer membrane lipoprotein SlyB